jgi:hydroxymethylpyrimidine/phosphomethylpyrimidine kinase
MPFVSHPGTYTPRVLSIAGSDSGGGAGIQADLKAFVACGVHGMTAITAITAQNTLEVRSVEPVSPRMVVDQVRAVVEDIGVDAVKIGMLGSAETIAAVEKALGLLGDVPVVLDPVMVAESGAALLDEDAREALATHLIPRVAVTTPNLSEARVLAELASGGAEEDASQTELAEAILGLGCGAVVVTGGHGDSGLDIVATAVGGTREVRGPWSQGKGAHGSGCTHSSVMAARLALGDSVYEAASRARELASGAVLAGLDDIGGGAGPVDVIGLPDMRDEMSRWA